MTSLTQAQIDAFENQRVGWWAKVTGKTGEVLLTGEQYQLLALEIISQQLAQLTQAIVGGQTSGLPQPITTGGSTTSNIVPPVGSALSPLVVISWDPERLDQIISLTDGLTGVVSDTVTQFPLTVPANGSLTVNIPPPPNSAAKLFGPLVITTTDVGAQVSVSASVDGHNVIGQQGFVLGPSTPISFHQYVVATQSGMSFTLTNPSSSAVTIYFNGELMTMTMQFYSSVYKPILQNAFSYVKQYFGLSVS